MNKNPGNLIHHLAENYRVFMVDFPVELAPCHLDVPPGEQASLFAGLSTLHSVIEKIYNHFSKLDCDNIHWEDKEYCYKAIEGSVKMSWILGAFGHLIQKPAGLELQLSREDLDRAIKKYGCKDPVQAFAILKTVGFELVFYDSDGTTSAGGYKKSAAVAVRYPDQNDALLRALNYYARRLPEKKSGRKEKGVIFEVFLRADFRPLLPGYTYHIPHLPATVDEVTRTFDSTTLEVWNALTGYMAENYPQYRLYFRVPFPRGRKWTADYSTKDNDYGAWTIFVDEGGLVVRIALIEGTINNMLEHFKELSPDFREPYLKAVACKDCSHCGKHVFYTYKDHAHRLCKSPWYVSQYLNLEDLPNIERLVDFRLAAIN